jgi:hypothetical protein
MPSRTLTPKRPGETEEQYQERCKAYWEQIKEDQEKLRAKRELITKGGYYGGQPKNNRTGQ